MRIPLPIQKNKKYDPDEFEECKEECSNCKWGKLERDEQGELWAICTSPDGNFEWKDDEECQ